MNYYIRLFILSCLIPSITYSMDHGEITSNYEGIMYESLAELKEKALQTEIRFIYQLSEFTYDKIKPETLEFYKAHGNLVDHNGYPAPNVTIIDKFAIDLKSELPWSRLGNLRLGQNIETKE